ncbi:hypothetical protein NG796_13905 [Laspinema sp. A4]|uniref:hypothetical protein n=1 Tax=Laspinema sp. D2d TaxID=2953686 RepID=UPI0021BBA249|nr:hypothetical protein [Laspinema sp. D2d]MCT7984393.1 hypothetical protein [Laspinema sp. D2d]
MGRRLSFMALSSSANFQRLSKHQLSFPRSPHTWRSPVRKSLPEEGRFSPVPSVLAL